MPKSNEFERPILTVDVVCFAMINKRIHALLVRREHAPFKGELALPGGYVHINEDGDTLAAAKRVTKSKLGMTISYMEQLGTFSGKERDPRGWSASVVYLAMIKPRNFNMDHEHYVVSGDDMMTSELFDIERLPTLAFDHYQIITAALQRIRNKTSYSSLPLFLMPHRFTLGQLQEVYEAIMGVKMDKASFRRRIVEQGIVEGTGVMQNKALVSHRPAELYKASAKTIQLFERDMA